VNIKNVLFSILGAAVLSAVLPCAAETNGTFRVASYNIRYIYGPDKPGSNDGWGERCGDMVRILHDMKLDVFGLQEVRPRQLDSLRAGMPEFAFVGDFRNADRKSGEASPVAFRKDRFEAEKTGTFWLSTKPDVPGSRSWRASCPRICSYAVLRDKRTGKRFCFATTHVDHRSAVAREKGLRLIVERTKAFGVPVVLTGDHNCNELSAPAKEISKVLDNALCITKTPPKGSWRTFNGWNYVEKEYPAAEAMKLTPEERNSKCGGSRLDFIYVARGTRVDEYETVNAVRKSRKMYTSDHFPVAATIELP